MDVDTPYSPPKEPGDLNGDEHHLVHEPRRVIGDRGAGWIMEGWDMFRAAPGQWMGFIVIGFVITLIINAIPFVNFLNSLLTEVWLAGVMTACQSQRDGGPVLIKHLFAGFGPKFSRLLLGGLALFGIQMAVMVPLILALFYDAIGSDNLEAYIENTELPILAFKIAIIMTAGFSVYAAACFMAPLMMLGNKSIGEAIKLSFIGCVRNWWPFLIYGFLTLLLALLIPLTLGLVLLVLVPVFFLSTYLSYRDIFVE